MNFVDDNVDGADVSYYQDNNTTPRQINFGRMVENNAEFVIIRAGQNVWIDPDFDYNWKNARAVGLLRGSYWLYDSRAEPEKQAELFAKCFNGDLPEMELWIDLEEHYGGKYAGWQNWKKFLEKLKVLLPTVKIGIYTSYGYIVGKIPVREMPYFLEYPLWLAWYTKDATGQFYPISSYVTEPPPWTSCVFWQWGTPPWGLAWGCESIEIDMNKFNGTRKQFYDRYNKITVPPVGGIMKEATVKDGITLNYRDGVGSSGTQIIGQLHAGDRVIGEISPTTNWFTVHHFVINGIDTVPTVQAYCSAYAGYYSTIVDYVPATPSDDVLELYVNGVMKIRMVGKVATD